MEDMRWRLVGDADDLRQRSCRRLRCVSSTADHQSSGALRDLVLVYVVKLDQFFALDGVCPHVGKSTLPVHQVDALLQFVVCLSSVVVNNLYDSTTRVHLLVDLIFSRVTCM